MLERRLVGGVDLDRRGGEGGVEIADRRVGLDEAAHRLRRDGLAGDRAYAAGGIRVFGVAHPDARGGIARRLETLGDDQGDGLAIEADAVVGEHRPRRAIDVEGRLHLVEGEILGLFRRVEMRHHQEHAGQALGLRDIDGGDPALGDRGADDEAIGGLALAGIFIGIAGAARDLERTVDTRQRAAENALQVLVENVAGIAGGEVSHVVPPSRSPWCARSCGG